MPDRTVLVNFLIGGGQLLIALLVFFGVDAKLLRSQMNLRTSVVMILIFGGLAFTAWGLVRTYSRPAVDIENIEPTIRTWLDNFRLGTQKLPVDNDSFFAYAVTLKNGRQVAIGRLKEQDRYLLLTGSLTLSPEHKAIADRLSRPQQLQVLQRVSLELARIKSAYVIEFPLKGLTVSRRVPITSDLTEAVLIERIDEMDSAIEVARASLALELERLAVAAP